MDRRDFLKSAVVLPLVPKVGGLPADTEVSKICTGQWKDLPAGWARFTNWQNAALPWPEVNSRYHLFPGIAQLLSARLTPTRVGHAIGHCFCVNEGGALSRAEEDAVIDRINREWWEGKHSDSRIDGIVRRWWPPTNVAFCDCDEWCDWCECERGLYLHPDHWPLRVHGAG
jgi:hypothetical protein